MVNVYINYEKKFAFVEFRTGAVPASSLWRLTSTLLWHMESRVPMAHCLHEPAVAVWQRSMAVKGLGQGPTLSEILQAAPPDQHGVACMPCNCSRLRGTNTHSQLSKYASLRRVMTERPLQSRRRATRWRWTASCSRASACACAAPTTTTRPPPPTWAPACPPPASTWRPLGYSRAACRLADSVILCDYHVVYEGT